jgi:hypothetical protein
MNYILRYSSTRAEVWEFYWRIWRGGLWLIHVFFAIGVSFVLSGSSLSLKHSISWAIYSLIAFPCVVTIFAAFPQLMFKNKPRTLEVGPDGWVTKIGKVSGSKKWSEIASVENVADAVQIKGKSGNAMIIPLRAFDSQIHMEQFISDVREWHKNNG